MLEKCKTAHERWGGVSRIIDHWLTERQELLVLFCAVQGLDEYKPKSTPQPVRLQALCQVLVDYVSAGHFEIYEKLFEEARDFDDGGLELAKALYPEIEKTTEIVIQFNDKYETYERCETTQEDLKEDLSVLGEALEQRFEAEDRLIETLHNAHRDMLAS